MKIMNLTTETTPVEALEGSLLSWQELNRLRTDVPRYQDYQPAYI